LNWTKLGHVFSPSGDKPWRISHAANPVAEWMEGDVFRVYFSCRDSNNRSSIAFVDIELGDSIQVVGLAEQPVLAPGDLGMFDDCGVSLGCVLPVGEKRYLYYMGWNLAVTVPWKNALGLAVSDGPGEPFVRRGRFPVVALSEIDPYSLSYPSVMREDGRFRMWYGSNIAWGPTQRDMRHLIKYAESDDGIHWKCDGVVALNFKCPQEYALCKPCVLKDADCYRMWFCGRGDVDRETYRICYAESNDGIAWRRMDHMAAIDVSPSGWDSEMIEYPSVFDHRGKRYLLYAGNGYGKTGFGLAVQDAS
jgi:hypothetical protein